MKKGLVSLLGAGALLAPVDRADAATVMTGINQFGSSADINYVFINDDSGATYNSATLDLNAVLAPLLGYVINNNPNLNSNQEVFDSMSFTITNAGTVYDGWAHSFDKSTGLISLTNNGEIPNVDYKTWTSDPNQNTLTGILNMNNLFNPGEQLAFYGTAPNAFTAQEGVFFYNSDVDRIGVIPEPSSTLLVGAGLGALALRRRREPQPTFPCVSSRTGRRAA